MAELHLATQAFDSSLKVAECKLRLQPTSSRSTEAAHLHDDAIPEQKAIDRPFDVSFAPDFAEMHAFMLGQHAAVAQSGKDYAVSGSGRECGATGRLEPGILGGRYRAPPRLAPSLPRARDCRLCAGGL